MASYERGVAHNLEMLRKFHVVIGWPGDNLALVAVCLACGLSHRDYPGKVLYHTKFTRLNFHQIDLGTSLAFDKKDQLDKAA